MHTAETRSHQDKNTTTNTKKPKKKKTSTENPVPMLVNQEEHFTRERLASVGSVDKDAMDEYLGTNNSQEHEEELLKYFKNNNLGENDPENYAKLSQLRQLLEQNGIAEPKLELVTSKRSIIKPDIKNSPQVTCIRQNNIPSNMYNSTTRRRVSFETPVQEETVPASPNTRRKNFSFTPISPGPLSPNGRQSKCSSTNASPFVSPRNTPVPRVRTSTHQNSGKSLFPICLDVHKILKTDYIRCNVQRVKIREQFLYKISKGAESGTKYSMFCFQLSRITLIN